MIDSVVGLVEERADSGGSRFSESSLERWRHAIVSLQNAVRPVCCRQCPPQFFHELTHCRC